MRLLDQLRVEVDAEDGVHIEADRQVDREKARVAAHVQAALALEPRALQHVDARIEAGIVLVAISRD
jgi:hypothetical protein